MIPVIFLTSKTDEGSELEGLSLGAIDYVAKPFSAPLLLKRIENHLLITTQQKELKNYNDNLENMVRQKTEQVLDLEHSVLGTVAEMVEFRDNITGGHIERTQRYLRILLDRLSETKLYEEEVSQWDLGFVSFSAQLLDVGKIAISDYLLNKPGKLTAEEFEEMKKHAEVGVVAISKIEERTREHTFLSHAKIIAGTHHEKWDGTGYPNGLRETDIPLEGRLMAIADVYDALISQRPYKRPLTTDEAEQIIKSGKGTHFDPALVDVFLSVAGRFAEVANSWHYGEEEEHYDKAVAESYSN
jgi:putative two-component system response regulator